MIIIGICGRSGSGKTTVGGYIKKKYPSYIDCDTVSREVTQKNSPCLSELVVSFGKEILNTDGTLNRAKLGELAFGNKEKTEKLNFVTHKHILEKIEFYIDKYRNQKEKFVFLDAPTLFESGLDKKCDFILGVVADENKLSERINLRDKKSFLEIEKRLSSQKTSNFIKEHSDYVIENNKTLEELEKKVLDFIVFIEEKYD